MLREGGTRAGEPSLVSMSAALKSSGNPPSEPTKPGTAFRVGFSVNVDRLGEIVRLGETALAGSLRSGLESLVAFVCGWQAGDRWTRTRRAVAGLATRFSVWHIASFCPTSP